MAREICKDEKSLEFFKKLGLKEPDIVDEVIKKILPKYSKNASLVSIEEHKFDIFKIEKAYATDSKEKKGRLRDQLRETPFVRIETQRDDGMICKRPCEIYFGSDEVRLYFSGNNAIGFVRPEYSQSAKELFEDLGVVHEIRVACKSQKGNDSHISLSDENGYRRGLNGFDPGIHVEGLECALNNISSNISEIIWNKISRKYSHCIKGRILRSSRRDFSPEASVYEEMAVISDFGHLLIETRWLPLPDGTFEKPCELRLDDLPTHLSGTRS